MEEMLLEQDWTGFYLESHRGKGWMNMRLQFQNGILKGEGVDYVGTWHLGGSYSLDDQSCSWTKRYLGQHDVQYAGLISDVGIMGQWDIEGMVSNKFHIWPVSMTHIQQNYLEAEDPVQQGPFSPQRRSQFERDMLD